MTVINSAFPLARDVQTPQLLDQLCHLHTQCNELVASRVSSQLTSSVLAAISSATESAQRAIDAANASASSAIESVLSASRRTSSIALASTPFTVRSTSSVAESTLLVGDSVNSVSHGLNINAGQLAGIVVGVFFLSSFSSMLMTYLMLRHRRRRISTMDPTGEAKRQWPWPLFHKSRGDNLTRRPTNTRFGRHQSSNRFLAKLRLETPPHLAQLKSPVHENQVPSPLSPSSTSDQIFPVSPISDEQLDAAVRERSPSLRLALFRNNSGRRGFRSEVIDAAPIKYTLSRHTTPSGTRQMQLVRVGNQGTDLPSPQQPLRTRNTFPSASKAPTLSTPPIIPLRFSSLNAYTAPPAQDPDSFLPSGHGTFLFLSDDESTEPAPEPPSQHQARSASSDSSIIAHDLTQFDPGGGAAQHPISRFSVSSVPGSLDYSLSSDSPVEQPHQPEISPLRPAPPSPSRLQAPVPMRPHFVSSAGVPATFYAWDSSDPETYALPGDGGGST